MEEKGCTLTTEPKSQCHNQIFCSVNERRMKAHWLDDASYVISFNQSESIILDYSKYLTQE